MADATPRTAVPADVIELADAAVASMAQLETAVAASRDAAAARDAALDECNQKLADLRNAITAAGLPLDPFQHGGYVFTDDDAALRMTPAAGALESLGGEATP